MDNLKVKGLTGLIISSPNPERLTTFYNHVLGLPFQLNQHGNLPQHWECDFGNIHYAILKQGRDRAEPGHIVPSFAVEDIEAFVAQHELSMLHPLMDLGGGSYVGSIKDVDGNVIRLWMSNKTGMN